LIRVLGLLLLTACAAKQTRYELPEDGPVIVLDTKGAKRAQPPLVIQQNGVMHSAAGETSIDPDQLQALLRFLVEEQRFLDIDSDAVRLAIHQENSQRGSALAILHAPTSILTLNLRDRTHRVEVHALQFEAKAHPKIESLQRLALIQRRIIREFSIALLGGERRAQRLCDLASEELATRHPERAPFTLTDLAAAGRRKDGSLVAHFRRDETATTFSYVIVLVPLEGEPTAQLAAR
jgi:hypothetical protein